MAERRVEYAKTFEKDIKHLSRKHAGFKDAVATFLNHVARADAPRGEQIPGLRRAGKKRSSPRSGEPVYKVRLPLAHKGKRGGARLIYHWTPDRLLAMFAYAKSDADDIPVKQIRDALSALSPQSEHGVPQD